MIGTILAIGGVGFVLVVAMACLRVSAECSELERQREDEHDKAYREYWEDYKR